MSKYESYNGHGFRFEDAAIYKYKLIPEPKYTHKWDAYVNNSQRTPVSVKTVGEKNEIVFGDIFRQARVVEKGFFAIVGVWEDSVDNLTEIYKLRINSSDWTKMFNQEIVDELEIFIKHARNNYISPESWLKSIDYFQTKWAETTESIMKPRFRRNKEDDGTYSGYRIQCAVSVKDFMSKIVGVETFGAKLIAKGADAKEILANFSNKIDEDPTYLKRIYKKKTNKKSNLPKEVKQESDIESLRDLLDLQTKELIIKAIYQLDRNLDGHNVNSLLEKTSSELSSILGKVKLKRKENSSQYVR